VYKKIPEKAPKSVSEMPPAAGKKWEKSGK
jgi:hypothetical protein